MTPTTLDAQAGALGSLIRELRRERGHTLKQLAALSGLSHPFLSQVERGVARPSFASLDAIARGLGTTQFELFALVSRRERETGTAEPAGAAFADGIVRVFEGDFRHLAPYEVVSEHTEFGEYFSHPEEEFAYLLSGAGLLDLGGDIVPLSAGDGVLIPSGARHRWRSVDGTPFRKLLIKALCTHEEPA
ncbi:helix-turn-helix domain-containing protein [Demequina mangrovi]|uniref:Transcriptional regulator, XRE family with cupin sensor n=1 Tax=Demequina mangrovi TaxID=1043493 RepID=A0A1H7A5P2_9MICO|nr:helix-turn-helix domain-containing protein [Demequina mangrovi]SEJ59734.1 transcriptional regulator, XRE family with cupin sensor [Demequina mangrovi]